ncbi:pentatricopeptide repeat-containing protein 1, mitochondrial-like [Vespa mandarinia]|uniref:pentatricopeptide repeat-containing protein 1, mitochondrial-like n=1 Tax=Vespa mandarinia TaxID=7446 RepID=UPI00161F96CC|nr:pentatricopeptide repeat-containing protein 1, mitochondrial-like [Vespa mandarinia]
MISTRINTLPIKTILGYVNNNNNRYKWKKLKIYSYNFRTYYRNNNVNGIFCSKIKLQHESCIPTLLDRKFCTRSEPKEEDVFGDIGYNKYDKVEMDKEEEEEEKFQDNIARIPRRLKLSIGQYAQKIKSYISNGDLSSALNVLTLVRENRDKPTNFMYNLLIRAYALQGDIKQCFSLYNKMKKDQLKPTDATYTSLFNACAESNNKSLALEQLNKLRFNLYETGYLLNETHYNTLVKVYSRHNCIIEAFEVVDEMRDKRVPIKEVTYNSLLNAAISDKEAGMRHALIIWHLMKKYRIKPSLITYNLLFRAMRDTKFGNYKINDVLMPELINTKLNISEGTRPNLLSRPPVINTLPIPIVIKNKNVECVLSPDTYLNDIFENNRFILFGGFENIIRIMEEDNVTPNEVTATLLLDLIPNTVDAENSFLQYIESKKITLDIDFYNMLIKRRSLRKEYGLAKKILEEIQRKHMIPNIMTFGVLAMGCFQSKQAYELIEGLEIAGYIPNIVILGTFISNACRTLNTNYVIEMIYYMRSNRIKPNEKILTYLNKYEETLTKMHLSKKYKFKKQMILKRELDNFITEYSAWKYQPNDECVIK